MNDDRILSELRQSREEHAKKYNYDLKAIVEDLKKTELEHIERVVSKEPKWLLRKTG